MTQHLAKDERRALEDYLIAGDDEEKAMKAINANVQGSTPYYYLYFLHKFRTVGVDGLNEEEKANLTKFTGDTKFSNTWQARQIALRYKLLRYDSAKTDKEERTKIVTSLLNDNLADDYNIDHKRYHDDIENENHKEED